MTLLLCENPIKKMSDVLSVLQSFLVNGKAILEKKDSVVFDEYSWPKSVKTNYLILRWHKPKEYYTLGCLLFFLKNAQLPHTAYVQKAKEENVPYIRRPDRKELLLYLSGKASTSESIDKNAPTVIPLKVKQEQLSRDDLKRSVKSELSSFCEMTNTSARIVKMDHSKILVTVKQEPHPENEELEIEELTYLRDITATSPSSDKNAHSEISVTVKQEPHQDDEKLKMKIKSELTDLNDLTSTSTSDKNSHSKIAVAVKQEPQATNTSANVDRNSDSKIAVEVKQEPHPEVESLEMEKELSNLIDVTTHNAPASVDKNSHSKIAIAVKQDPHPEVKRLEIKELPDLCDIGRPSTSTNRKAFSETAKTAKQELHPEVEILNIKELSYLKSTTRKPSSTNKNSSTKISRTDKKGSPMKSKKSKRKELSHLSDIGRPSTSKDRKTLNETAIAAKKELYPEVEILEIKELSYSKSTTSTSSSTNKNTSTKMARTDKKRSHMECENLKKKESYLKSTSSTSSSITNNNASTRADKESHTKSEKWKRKDSSQNSGINFKVSSYNPGTVPEIKGIDKKQSGGNITVNNNKQKQNLRLRTSRSKAVSNTSRRIITTALCYRKETHKSKNPPKRKYKEQKRIPESGTDSSRILEYRFRDRFTVFGEIVAHKMRMLSTEKAEMVQRVISDILWGASKDKYNHSQEVPSVAALETSVTISSSVSNVSNYCGMTSYPKIPCPPATSSYIYDQSSFNLPKVPLFLPPPALKTSLPISSSSVPNASNYSGAETYFETPWPPTSSVYRYNQPST